MKMNKSIVAVTVALVSFVAFAGESTPFLLDTLDLLIDSPITYNSAWVGGDSSAEVVITADGTEIKRTTGSGEFAWSPATSGKHTLTYTTYINGVAQDEVYTATVFKDWKYTVEDGKATITGTGLSSGSVTIPSEIDGCPVVGIENGAFANCDFDSVTIPPCLLDTVSSIKSFEQNDWMRDDTETGEVYRSNDITDSGSTYMTATVIGPCEFSFDWKVSSESGCDELKWYLNDSAQEAISGETDWQSVTYSLEEGEHTIKWWYYKDESVDSGSDCGWVRRIEALNTSVKMSNLFPDCFDKIQHVALTGNAKEIPQGFFEGCAGMREIIVPSSVKRIASSAFSGCSSLSSVVIPDSVINIGANAFANCESLERVVVPYGCMVHEYTFYGSYLKYISLPKTCANVKLQGLREGVEVEYRLPVPDEFMASSGLKIGKIYCGGWWNEIYFKYSVSKREILCHELWEEGYAGLWGDEFAFISVAGEGDINPVIFHGDTPISHIGDVQIWSDERMFDEFTPDLDPFRWESDGSYWWCESGNSEYSWPKSIWPDKRVVPGRRWIVVPLNDVSTYLGPYTKFRVGIGGTSEISDSIVCGVGAPDQSQKLKPEDFFHGVEIDGFECFDIWEGVDDDIWWSRGPRRRTEGYAFVDRSEFMQKNVSFTVGLPSAGTLVIYGNDEGGDDNLAQCDQVSVSSDNGAVMEDDDDFLKGNTYIRRIVVSRKTILTFVSNGRWDEEIEFKSLLFYPESTNSVFFDVAYAQQDVSEVGDIHLYPLKGHVKGGGVYVEGETVKLEAIANSGESFSHWECDDISLTEKERTSATLSVRVTADMCGAMKDEKRIFIRAVWKPKYRVEALPSIVGAGTVTGSGRYFEGETVTLKAIAASGCTFVKWSDGETSPTRTVKVDPTDVERVIYAYFKAPNGVPSTIPTPDEDPGPTPTPDPDPTPTPPVAGDDDYALYEELYGSVPENAASVYDGYLYDGDEIVGTVQAKVSKPKTNKKLGMVTAKTTVAIQIAGEKKVSLKGEMDVDSGMLEVVAKDGRVLSVEFGSDGMFGKFDRYEIDGARNFFSSKDKAEKAEAEGALAPWLGTMNMFVGGESRLVGDNEPYQSGTLSVTIAKKGKITVKGTVDGVKVSAKSQALIGEDWICIPVIYSKKTLTLAFALWLPIDGGEVQVVGLDAVVGVAGTLKAGAEFYIDDAILSDIYGIIRYKGASILPDGESVSASGKKWVVAGGAKAAKVAYKKGVLTVTPGKKGGEVANISGLKLTYMAKDGSFTGSFTVYALEGSKLKKHKASVSGVLIEGIGYGTATIKKLGSWSVEIR